MRKTIFDFLWNFAHTRTYSYLLVLTLPLKILPNRHSAKATSKNKCYTPPEKHLVDRLGNTNHSEVRYCTPISDFCYRYTYSYVLVRTRTYSYQSESIFEPEKKYTNRYAQMHCKSMKNCLAKLWQAFRLLIVQRLNFDTILKILHKVPLSGQDRPSHWLFRDPWAISNVSICPQNVFHTILSNFLGWKNYTNLPPGIFNDPTVETFIG